MNPHRRWFIAVAVGGALLVAAIASLRPAKEAVRNPAPIASPNDNASSAGELTDGAMRPSNSATTDRDSLVASVPPSLPPVVFEFPNADPRLVEPATIEEFFTSHRKGRFRIVTVDTDEIREVIRDKLRGVDRVVTVRFFPDVVVSAMTFTTSKEGYTGQNAGFAVWSGMEVGTTSASMAMAISPDGETIGEFSTSKGNFNIAATAQPPFHIVWQDLSDAETGPID